MDLATRRLIEAIHSSPLKAVLVVTGGGSGAVADLLGVPGASRTVLEAVVPYDGQALTEYLGHRPDNFCSEATGQDLARRAFGRACWLSPGEAVCGLGCTASLATDRPKKGEHRVHLALHLAERQQAVSLVLTKGARDRAAEEAVLDALLLNLLADAAGVAERLPIPLLRGEQIQQISPACDDPLVALLRGTADRVCVESDGRLRLNAPLPAVLLPGAFNPAHVGHRRLAEVAERLTGRPAAFELSVQNVDKPPLGLAEIRRRIEQFTWQAPLWLTRAPTFLEKARLFPGTVFVVGLDTAERIVATRYYAGDEERLCRALAEIQAAGCRFLVAGRADADRFRTLDDVTVPDSCSALFQAIPEAGFRLDVSSTRLREPGR